METVLLYVLESIVIFLLGVLTGIWVGNYVDSRTQEKHNKPMIRHCQNCKYGDRYLGYVNCGVKYKVINPNNQRNKALFCRFFKKKEVIYYGK